MFYMSLPTLSTRHMCMVQPQNQPVLSIHAFSLLNLFPAEFIIALSAKNNTFESFKKVLDENGAEFSVSLLHNFF